MVPPTVLQRGRPPKGPKRPGGQVAYEGGAFRFNAVGPRRGRRAHAGEHSTAEPPRFNAVGPRRGRRGRPPGDRPPATRVRASTRSAPEGAEERMAWPTHPLVTALQRGRPPKGPKRGNARGHRDVDGHASTRSAPEGAEEHLLRVLDFAAAQLQRGRPPKGPKRECDLRRVDGARCRLQRGRPPKGPKRRRDDHDLARGQAASTRSAPEGAEESRARGQRRARRAVASTRSAPEGAEEGCRYRAASGTAPRFNAVGPRRGRRGEAQVGDQQVFTLQRGRPPKGPKGSRSGSRQCEC